jgi:hypothetical protein
VGRSANVATAGELSSVDHGEPALDKDLSVNIFAAVERIEALSCGAALCLRARVEK